MKKRIPLLFLLIPFWTGTLSLPGGENTLASAGNSITPAQTLFQFEAEEIVDPEDSNRSFWRGWNEKGASWGTMGTLLRGPNGDADRDPLAKEAYPVRLKFELPDGIYRVSARGGRTVGLSFDGGNKFLRAAFPGNREIPLLADWSFPGGVCTVILSNCHAEKDVFRRGPVYLDYLKFERLRSASGRKPVSLNAVTNRPFTGLFILGETPQITFTLKNLTQEHKNHSLNVRVTDEHNAELAGEKFSVVPDLNGQWQKTWQPPCGKKGFYRVFADFDGVTLPGIGTKPAGFITYGITFDPEERRLYPRERTFFGMQGRFFGKTVEAVPLLGIRWVRGPAQWKTSCRYFPEQYANAYRKAQAEHKKFPEDPRPDVTVGKGADKRPWTTYFYCTGVGANNCHPDRWKVPACTAYSPSWGTIGPWGVLTQEGKRGFALYMDTLAESVAGNYPEDPERIYEVLWEPTAYYSGSPADLIEYLKIARESLRKFSPKARIAAPTLDRLSYESTIFGSPAAGKDNFLEYTKKLFQAGMAEYLDVYAIHPYTHSRRAPEETRMAEAIRELKILLRNETGRDIPIIGTEHGYSSSDFTSELNNARFIVRGNLILLGEGVLFNIAFYPCFSVTEGSDFGFFYCTEPKGRTVISPRPQAIAYAAMTRFLEGFRPTETLDLPGTARGYAYENGEDVVLALWDYREQNRELKIPVGKKVPRIFDWMGNELAIRPEKGFLTLRIGPEVLYLTNIDPECFGKRAKRTKITFETPRLRLYPGEKGSLDAIVKTPASEKISVQVLTESAAIVPYCSDSVIELAENAEKRLRIALDVPHDISANPQKITLKLQDNKTKRILALAEYELEILPSVEIIRAAPTVLYNGSFGLNVLLEEKSGSPRTFELGLELNGKSFKNSAALNANGKKEITVPLGNFKPDYKRKYPFSLAASVQESIIGTLDGTVNFTPVIYFPEGAFQNAALRNWAHAPVLALGRKDCIRNATIYSGDTAQIAFGWNREALFLRVSVRDNVILQGQKEVWNLWRDDCLQWGICLEPWKQRINSGNTLIDKASAPKQIEFVLAALSGKPAVYRSRAVPEQKNAPRELLSQEEFSFSLNRNENLLIYEAAVPWETLGLEKAPRYLSSTVAVNDRDSRASGLSAMSLFAGACEEKFPELMGILTLTEEEIKTDKKGEE